jgi:TadE-like protein
MKKRLFRRQAPAQAIVEFALAATLIFFLLAAVVDLGLIYFTMQALRVAAQEGATYGSYPKSRTVNDELEVYLDAQNIVLRVYGAAGDQPGGFANLRDLNGNGLDDLNVDRLHDNMMTDPNAYIYVENLRGFDPNSLAPACRGDVGGVEFQNGGNGCWIRVTVRYDYRFNFPFAPAFAETVRLQASHLMPIRSSFYTAR